MTKTMFATLALTATVVFAGPAFAEKFKATLDGKSEVPPNATTGTGTADIDYDAATKTLKPQGKGADCGYACHTSAAADDYIFTHYPAH